MFKLLVKRGVDTLLLKAGNPDTIAQIFYRERGRPENDEPCTKIVLARGNTVLAEHRFRRCAGDDEFIPEDADIRAFLIDHTAIGVEYPIQWEVRKTSIKHPNRNPRTRGIPPASPTPEQVRDLRTDAGLTQTEAAELVHVGHRTWQSWEAATGEPSSRTMPAAAWELFTRRLRDRRIKIPDYLEKYFDSQGV